MKSLCLTLVQVFSHSRCQCWALLALMAHYSRHVADTKLLKTKLAIHVPCLESRLTRWAPGRSQCWPSPAASRRTPATTPALCPTSASPPASRLSSNRNQSVTLIRPRISGEARRPKPSIILQMPNSQILTTTTNGGREKFSEQGYNLDYLHQKGIL